MQRAADYLRSTAAWPSSGDVAVNVRPTGTYKSTTDPNTTLSLRYDNAARAPNANRWLIWRRDPAYGGRAVIANPDGSDADKTAVIVSDTAYNNYMIFDGIRFTGESVPKGRAEATAHRTASTSSATTTTTSSSATSSSTASARRTPPSYESVEGIYQSGTTGPSPS